MKSSEGLRLNQTQETLETDQTYMINALKLKNIEQERQINDFKERENGYKDKIFELEKELREAKHQLELSKMDYDRQVNTLQKQLDDKTDELDKQLEDFVMNKLDLDEFNLTSDDFRNSESNKAQPKTDSRNHAFNKRINKKQNVTKTHPLVPKLDFSKIFEWREKTNNDNIIMIRISDSRITGEDRITEEVNDDNGIQKANKKYFAKGSNLNSDSKRITELFDRKQQIINALNQAYADEDEESITDHKGEEYDTDN